jgi:energy-coupling factor transporter ATP-binding protein EcfA2
VRDLDLEIAPGEHVLLLGASGSGKSTLLRALAGVLGDDEGEQLGSLEVDGRPPSAARGRVGLVLQDPESNIVLSRVGDDVAFGCKNLGIPRDEIWPRVREALDAVGLDVPLDRATGTLSGGEKQRLALAGSLAMRPGLLLLDEPTANLDPAGVTEVRDAVGRALSATGASMVVVEHRVQAWLPLVDRVIVLTPAGVIADGDPARVLRDRGAELAAAGIWVPGHPPALPKRRRHAVEVVETAVDLTVGRDRVPVLSGLDVRVSAGELLAITGPNGSGKSTLGLTLAGLLPPLSGELDAFGRGSPHRWRSRELLPLIGTVFQNPEHQFLTGTVRDELEVGPRALNRPLDHIDGILERLRLTPLARANPFTLSGGEQRRLSVATVLASAPRMLVLDEPTFGQDANTWAELVALIAELIDDGSALVAMTHDAEFVEALADQTLPLGIGEL